MVLRKPYAFLIKHFKAIHLILVVLMAILSKKLYDTYTFISSYLSDKDYNAVSGVVSKYLGFSALILPIIIIGIIITVIVLLKRKDKPILYYLVSGVVYLIELIVVIVGITILSSIQTGTINTTYADVVKDFIFGFSILPIPLIVIALVRGVGFNVRQFNFQKDLVELNIVAADNEEFEVSMDFDSDNIKTKLNRNMRFLKYTYMENKPIFIGTATIIVLVIAFSIFNVIRSIEHIYSEGDTFKAYGVKITVNKTYQTKLDLKGKVIDDDKTYVIVNVTAKNTLDTSTKLPYKYIYLASGDNQYSLYDNKLTELSDFGYRYTSKSSIEAGKTETFNLVYQIDDKDADGSKRLSYIKSANGSKSYKFYKVKLNAVKFTEYKKMSTYTLGDTLSFETSLIEGTKFYAESIEIADKFTASYKKKIGDSERTFNKVITPSNETLINKTIIRIKGNITKNSKLNKKIYDDFLSNFVSVEYGNNKKMSKTKTSIIDLTPTDFDDGYLYIEIDKAVSSAKKINLIFTIRDKKYTYNIKDEG